MARKLTFMITVVVGAMLALLYTAPSESPAKGVAIQTPTYPTPSASTYASEAVSLPYCDAEDGAGVALCMWDGVVSGDCAPDYVGGQRVSDMCVRLYAMGEGMEVQTCAETYNVTDDDILIREGWTMEECFKALLGE